MFKVIKLDKSSASKRVAAIYLRMSTDHQQYSPENQRRQIEHYAAENNIEIIKTYVDLGRSGLTIKNRPGLQKLISDVVSQTERFNTVLILDVSRWGRYQDIDESAYYEFICRKSGCEIIYVSEPFINDHNIHSDIIKSLKRTMAGEYSRELSRKCFIGHCNLGSKGFLQGGCAGYGLRRQLLDEHGNKKLILNEGEHKSLQTERTVLTIGPARETKVIRWVYKVYLDGLGLRAIARTLNQKNILTAQNNFWTSTSIKKILTNERYIGTYVYNKLSRKLKGPVIANSPTNWIIAKDALPNIIDERTFYKVQLKMEENRSDLTREEVLIRLRDLYQEHGYLSSKLIASAKNIPSASTLKRHFSSLMDAYKEIGYNPIGRKGRGEITSRVSHMQHEKMQKIIYYLNEINLKTTKGVRKTININGQINVFINLCRCTYIEGRYQWINRSVYDERVDFILLGCMDQENLKIQSYFLIPPLILENKSFTISEFDKIGFYKYLLKDLSQFYDLLNYINIKNFSVRLPHLVDTKNYSIHFYSDPIKSDLVMLVRELRVLLKKEKFINLITSVGIIDVPKRLVTIINYGVPSDEKECLYDWIISRSYLRTLITSIKIKEYFEASAPLVITFYDRMKTNKSEILTRNMH